MHFRSGYEVREETLKEMRSIVNSSQWQFQSEDEDGVKVFTSIRDKETLCLKLEMEYDINATAFYDVIRDVSQQPKWDAFLEEAIMLEEYDQLNHIIYLRFYANLPEKETPFRYFLLYRACSADPVNEKYIVAFRSVDHEKFSSLSGGVKCDCHPSGWFIEALGQKKTKIVWIHQVNFKLDMRLESEQAIFQSFGMYGRMLLGLKGYFSQHADVPGNTYHSTISDGVQSFKNISTLNGWRLHLKSAFSSIEILTNTFENDQLVFAIKGNFTCDFMAQTVFDQLSPSDSKFDIFFKNLRVIEEIDSSISIIHSNNIAWSAGLQMDVCMRRQLYKLNDGSFWIGFHSTTHPNCPTNDSYQRQTILSAGYFIFPVGKNATLVNYVVKVADPDRKSVEHYNQMAPIVGAQIVSSVNTLLDHTKVVKN